MKAASQEYDVIVLGGGASGSVIASRLTESPQTRVLLVESGKDNFQDPDIQSPLKFLSLLMGDKVKHYSTEPNTHLPDNRVITFAQGHVLGGSSSVNWMMYTRPAESDFDEWSQLNHNDPEWTSAKHVNYLKKQETYQVDSPSKDKHGYDGPLKVSMGERTVSDVRTDVSTRFRTACLENGIPVSDDVNDGKTTGASHWRKWIDKDTGKRSDAAHGYLHPNKSRPNLEIITEAQVQKILTEGTGSDLRATGAEVKDVSSGEKFVVKAGLVVLSAGAINSPVILQHSGIGPKDVLESAGVPLVLENENVGKNLQDHLLLGTHFYCDPSIYTHDEVLWSTLFGFDGEKQKAAIKEWEEKGTGPMTTNSIDFGVRYRPRSEQELEGYPAIQKEWRRNFANKPDKPLFNLYHASGYVLEPQAYEPGRTYFGIGVNANYPDSRGSVSIRSSDVDEPPRMEGCYLRTEFDVETYVMGWKLMRSLARKVKGFRGEQPATNPVFREGSKAALAPYAEEDYGELAEPVYDEEDDKAIATFVKKLAGPAWHPCATCSMLPRDEGGVVSTNLDVHGVKGLKVADMSISPRVPGGNTYSTALSIGEHASDIIKRELAV
ncbi:alcohol oxidase [Violaceomyces palustris]|uniref:Alcohol oxidase n=1 Tax=Violaceomyces palustris TaxID=1673888 RepID=A0ACD0NLP2_9BASI|nr:alcohol oxidase [Violaceomyces palustris]